ncbi:MAG TPA: GIY-YIG nuclease family protein [Thermomicrobiales bacterium]|nr:GIY-YIG nuclease family protein [Thermomicrobiales bacterium]
MSDFFVYILANSKRTIYIGVTNSLERRLWEHRGGITTGFASEHGCDQLVYFEDFASPRDAIAREKQVKGWRREKKIALIEAANPDWLDLGEDWRET